MNKNEVVAYAKKQIQKARTEKAIQALSEYVNAQDLDMESELIQLSGRYARNEKDNLMGILPAAQYRMESARINMSLLALLEDLEDDNTPTLPPKIDAVESQSSITKVLFFAANPEDTGRLRLGEEVRDIKESLIKIAKLRDKFKLIEYFATRAKDMQRALLDESPNIVHFSGHGIGAGQTDGGRALGWIGNMTKESVEKEGLGIALEGSSGQIHIVGGDALAELFELFSDTIKCVILNACYSKSQAEALVEHIPYVIGMRRAVNDKTAITFAVSFYDALGAGRDIPFAFKLAKAAVKLQGLPGEDIPVLLQKK